MEFVRRWELALTHLLAFRRKSGVSGLAAEGKERYTEYNKDKADGKVDWGKEAKDASKDWRGPVSLSWPPLVAKSTLSPLSSAF